MSIPHLIDLQKEHGGKNFTVVGVSLDQQSQVLPPFVTQWKMNYPVVNDSDGAVARAYGGIRSIPTGVLIDRHGKVITGFVGYHPKEEMEAMVEQALAKKD
jgi:peroxiredoxin